MSMETKEIDVKVKEQKLEEFKKNFLDALVNKKNGEILKFSLYYDEK